jgi:hypothetical protein
LIILDFVNTQHRIYRGSHLQVSPTVQYDQADTVLGYDDSRTARGCLAIKPAVREYFPKLYAHVTSCLQLVKRKYAVLLANQAGTDLVLGIMGRSRATVTDQAWMSQAVIAGDH